jgi:O-antigen/teichoic acid export membrane protein
MTARALAGFDLERLQRVAQQLLLVGLRGGNAIAKFALTLYIARYLQLADLGLYGLLVGASTMLPALLGFGLTDWTSRLIVTLSRGDAIPYVTTRLGFSLALHLVGQPLAWFANYALGAPVPWHLVLLLGAILVLEHLATDLYFLLVARARAQLAAVTMFLRGGIWPPVIIALGLIDPGLRNLEAVLIGWLGGLALSWAVVGVLLASEARWRHLRLRLSWLAASFRPSMPFLVKEMSGVTALYLDRFLVSIFLGLELTGVYTFFWSIANLAQSLVYGLIQTHLPDLAGAERRHDRVGFARFEKRLHFETAIWSALLLGIAAVAIPLLLPFIGRPLLEEYLPVLWLIMFGALVHCAANALDFVLFATHRDKAIALISIGAAITSAACNLVLVPFTGLVGAALTYVLTGIVETTLALKLRTPK